ncbi:MAG: hypothetical protein MJ192_00775 [Clostridia bacterium]|nr:hypothetical protein [Clostridia bacterium]
MSRSTPQTVRSLSHELKRQKKQNERLRKENEELRKRLDKKENDSLERSSIQAEDVDRRIKLYRQQSFFRYFSTLFNTSPAYRLINRSVNVFKKFKLVRTIISIIALILASTVLLTLILTILPFLIAFLLLVVLLTVLSIRRMNKLMKQRLIGKRIVILIPPPDCTFRADSFFVGSTRELADREDTAVLVVSPYHLLTRGISGKGPYLTARKEGYDLYMVRPVYFFMLRKFVIDKSDADVTLIF